MSAGPAAPPPDGSYIRGGGGVEIHTRRVVGAVVAVGVAVLATLVTVLTISAAHQGSQLSTLRHQGVPVEATVTGCLAIGSGVGMGVEYWQCRGTYSLGRQSYNEVIQGSRTLLDAGQKIPAVAVPGQPTLLSTVSAAGKPQAAWTRYMAPALLTVVGVAGLLVWVLFSRRRRLSGAGP